jgi:WD40 repeat protein
MFIRTIYAKLWFSCFVLLTVFSPTLSTQQDYAATPVEEEPAFIFGGLAWSPDGEFLAVGTNKGIWLHDSSDLSVETHLTNQPFVSTLDWHPDGSKIVSGDSSGTVRVWNVETQELLHELNIHTYPITSIKYSPDGTLIANASWDDTISIVDAEEYQELRVIQTEGFTTDYTINWSSDSRQVASQGQDGIAIWDALSGDLNLSWSFNREIPSLKWSPDNQWIATGGLDGEIRIWDVSTQTVSKTFDLGNSFVLALAWSPTSTYLAAYRMDSELSRSSLQIWDVPNGELVKELPNVLLTGDVRYTNTIAWSPNGNLLASTSDDGKIFIWETQTYEALAIYEGYKSMVPPSA